MELPKWFNRLPRLVGRALCVIGVHSVRLQHEYEPGHLGSPGRNVAVVKCWWCGRCQ